MYFREHCTELEKELSRQKCVATLNERRVFEEERKTYEAEDELRRLRARLLKLQHSHEELRNKLGKLIAAVLVINRAASYMYIVTGTCSREQRIPTDW